MTPEHYKKLKQIFLEARAKPEDEQDRFLQKVCEGDDLLCSQVHELLKAHAEETVAEDDDQDADDTRAPQVVKANRSPSVPHNIGPYSIERIIASGGMGTVYEATQEQPRRSVALKVMKPGIVSEATLKRFEYESQILARLRHPGIAQVYEAGTHRDNGAVVPYFAMEYIPDARTITEYAKDNTLGTRERLRLFQQVTDAVQHGHQKGIIHRDLKPGNILVDAQGHVKVIDFGVAKATESDMVLTTMQTDVGQLIGTVQYMSPEQVEADPHDIDVRSDVYALGIILFELLCDCLPYDLRNASIFEATRVIREQAPTRPSSVLRTLRGDIETITLKALEKDRERRYASAEELGTDIRRYLAGETISARPATVAYQLRVFARRNKVACAAAVTLFITLIAATAFSTRQYFIADAARKTAEEERQNAEDQRDEAVAIKDFVTQALVSSDPYQEGDQGMTVADAMARAVELLDAGKLKGQRVNEAALRHTIAVILMHNSRPDEGLRLATQSLEIRRQLHQQDHAATATNLNTVANGLMEAGRFEDALVKFKAALEMNRRLSAEDGSAVIRNLQGIGDCLQFMGRPTEALPVHEEALTLSRSLYDGDDNSILQSLNKLASCLEELGRLDAALPMKQEALVMARRIHEPDSAIIGMCTNNLATCLMGMQRFDEALPLCKSSLQICKRRFQGDHHDTANALANMGGCLASMNRIDEALTNYQASLAMYQRLVEGDHPGIANAYRGVGHCLTRKRKHDEALTNHTAALEMRRRLFSGNHPAIASSLNDVAVCMVRLGRPDDALRNWEAAIEMNRSLFGTEHPSVAMGLNNLASFMVGQGRVADALPRFEESLELHRKLLPPEHPHILHPHLGLVRTLVSLGRYAEAEPLLLEAAKRVEESEACRRMHGDKLREVAAQLYDLWNKAEPGQGHNAKADEWRSRRS